MTTKTLRFYEDEGLLPEPARTPAGYRDYPNASPTSDGGSPNSNTPPLSSTP